jgi:transposase
MRKMTQKRYTAEFKAQAAELAGLGKPVPVVAEELGVNVSVLYRWISEHRQAAQVGSEGLRAGGEESAADELRRLRRELAELKMENNILKKAAIILGTKTQSPLEQ